MKITNILNTQRNSMQNAYFLSQLYSFAWEAALSYRLKVQESMVYGKKKYANAKGNTECVEFVRQTTGAPPTTVWSRGMSVKEASLEAIPRGTAIATFDENGRYPTDGSGRHAAVFLGKNTIGIQVLDQWNSQGEVLPRTIRFNNPGKRSNNGDNYYVVE